MLLYTFSLYNIFIIWLFHVYWRFLWTDLFFNSQISQLNLKCNKPSAEFIQLFKLILLCADNLSFGACSHEIWNFRKRRPGVSPHPHSEFCYVLIVPRCCGVLSNVHDLVRCVSPHERLFSYFQANGFTGFRISSEWRVSTFWLWFFRSRTGYTDSLSRILIVSKTDIHSFPFFLSFAFFFKLFASHSIYTYIYSILFERLMNF